MTRTTIILSVCVAIPPLLLACLAVLHTWAHEDSARASEQEAKRLMEEVAELKSCLARVEQLRKHQLPAIRRLAPVLEELVGEVSAPPRFLPLFESKARACGVVIKSCRWSEDRPHAGPSSAPGTDVARSDSSAYGTVSFFITVHGPAEGILAYIGALESNARPIAIAEVEMNRKTDPRLPLEARLHAKVVIRNGNS